MICGIKIPIKSKETQCYLRSISDFKSTYTYLTMDGEILTFETRLYNCFNIVFHESFDAKLNGSLHKYYNNGVHNFDDFSYFNLCESLEKLHENLHINLFDTYLQNLEFGVNLVLETPVSDLLKRIVGKGKFQRFEIHEEMRLKGFARGYRFRTKSKGDSGYVNNSQYDIKLYDKGLQYLQSENIFRFEYSANKMQCIQGAGIRSLYDLSDISKLYKLAVILIKQFDQLIIIEDVNPAKLSKAELKVFIECANPYNWHFWSANIRDKRKRHLEEIQTLYSSSNYKKVVRNLLISKLEQLMPGLTHVDCFTLSILQ